MDRRDELIRVFNKEVEDEVARARLYNMLQLDSHAADTIAKNLTSLHSRLPIGRIVKLLNDTKKDKQWVSDRIQELKDADRKHYKRRGCAPELIDVIVEAYRVPPSQIYAPGTVHVSQIIRSCIEFISERPIDLSDWEKNLLKTRIEGLSNQGEVVKASTLAKLTEDTSLPSHVFLGDSENRRNYKAFRESVMPIVDEIAAFYFGDQLRDQMCGFVKKEFKKLVMFIDDDPGSFVNDFYIRFRQQVLDGNTAFSNRKLPFKSYLMISFRYFLIDKVKILQRRSKQQLNVQEVRRQMGLIRTAAPDWQLEAESVTFEKDIVLETILCIPDETDRRVLQGSLVDGLFGTAGYAGRMTKRALLRWSNFILNKLGESYEELPRGLQLQLGWYSKNVIACFLRNILRLEQKTRKLGHNRQWLAKELGVSDRSLGKWIRLEVFPQEQSVELAKNSIARLERVLGVSDAPNMSIGEVDYA